MDGEEIPPYQFFERQKNDSADRRAENRAKAAEQHHVYETRGQALIAREQFGAYDGSLISYLEHNGLLGPRLNIVHSVWISRAEMDRRAGIRGVATYSFNSAS